MRRRQSGLCGFRRRLITLPWTCARRCLGRAAGAHRPRREAAEAQQPVVHHDRTGDREIDAKAGRDPHDVIAARDHRRRQRAALGAEHVGGVQRMAKARQRRPPRRAARRRSGCSRAAAAAARPNRSDRAAPGAPACEVSACAVSIVWWGSTRNRKLAPKACAERDQVAEVHRLADALRADPEIAAHAMVLSALGAATPARSRCRGRPRLGLTGRARLPIVRNRIARPGGHIVHRPFAKRPR